MCCVFLMHWSGATVFLSLIMGRSLCLRRECWYSLSFYYFILYPFHTRWHTFFFYLGMLPPLIIALVHFFVGFLFLFKMPHSWQYCYIILLSKWKLIVILWWIHLGVGSPKSNVILPHQLEYQPFLGVAMTHTTLCTWRIIMQHYNSAMQCAH